MKERLDPAENWFDRVIKTIDYPGVMVSDSKSDYIRKYPNHVVVFNANIFAVNVFTGYKEKIWFGDIDLFYTSKKLQDLANELDISLYILREMDGRFDHQDSPLLDEAVAVFESNV